MPLPAEGSTWPPKALDPVTSQLAVWSAWYSSGTDTLSGIYGGDLAGNVAHAPGTDAMRNDRRGRIAATLARWFWGTKTPQNERRTKLHLPVARDIAATSSDILFGEPLTLQVEDSAAQDRLDELTGLDLRATLAESGELAAGMGGIYQRIVWDREVRDRPWLSAVHARLHYLYGWDPPATTRPIRAIPAAAITLPFLQPPRDNGQLDLLGVTA